MDQAVQTLENGRDYALDRMKSVAIIGVLLIHASAVGFSGYPVGSASWVISAFWGTILRAAVPIFFMVSGALLLRPEKRIETKRIYTKYLLRIVVALFFWAAAYEAFDLLLKLRSSGITGADIKNALQNLIFFKHHFHLYYLHIILLVYACLPITRVFVAHATKRQMQYALLLWAALGIFYPFLRGFYPLNAFWGIPAQYAINMTYGAIGYGVLGYYLKTYRMSKKFSLLYLPGFLIAFLGTIFASIHAGAPVGTYYEGMSPGVALMAVGIFVFLNEGNILKRRAVLCKKLSLASFAIYLVHDFFYIIFRRFGFDALAFSPIFSIPCVVLANLCLSFCIYWVLSNIPIVKKYLV